MSIEDGLVTDISEVMFLRQKIEDVFSRLKRPCIEFGVV